MSEKVLGFYEKDAVAGIWRDMNLDKRLIYLKMETGELRKVWLVPVVSVEWLKKWCKEHQDYFFKPHHKDLLSAVEKEAGKK